MRGSLVVEYWPEKSTVVVRFHSAPVNVSIESFLKLYE